ncbi:hypothetical protein PPTG_10979 [Phytophthora nicotianae INRA-310]|uniref:Uncharacterized protein n=1 Tax=Phytophthora nicotianae (strain INRA-310) TaxID=761204 RepID=W2QB07_PHYN3|nr:hypothetical protein PPTG_10979 [Phytophthora nicotianae INRA-310]ETN10327.1 hypothetical protein PPTG_10979 [Phytophthora nicotianae INRA-310]
MQQQALEFWVRRGSDSVQDSSQENTEQCSSEASADAGSTEPTAAAIDLLESLNVIADTVDDYDDVVDNFMGGPVGV